MEWNFSLSALLLIIFILESSVRKYNLLNFLAILLLFVFMSLHAPEHTGYRSQSPCRITIVASRYNEVFVTSLIREAQKAILALAPETILELLRVPGAFEIPLAIKLVAEHQKPDAIIALGVILRGETAHAHLIATALSEQLLALSLEYSLPVIHEVLLLDSQAQARARCFGSQINRGAEAGQCALSMIEVTRSMIAKGVVDELGTNH